MSRWSTAVGTHFILLLPSAEAICVPSLILISVPVTLTTAIGNDRTPNERIWIRPSVIHNPESKWHSLIKYSPGGSLA